jgi:hypothetical protein
MDRLYQIILAVLVAFGMLTGERLHGDDSYCSLSVRVLSPDGRRPEVPVSVEESSGRVVDEEQEGDDVKFCDLGIRSVTVTVGVLG